MNDMKLNFHRWDDLIKNIMLNVSIHTVGYSTCKLLTGTLLRKPEHIAEMTGQDF